MEARRMSVGYAGCVFAIALLAFLIGATIRLHTQRQARLALSLLEMNNRIDETLKNAYTNVAQTYFQAGVSSAQLAYREWQHAALISGHLPTEYATDEWKAAATRAWLACNTNEHYIQAP